MPAMPAPAGRPNVDNVFKPLTHSLEGAIQKERENE
jgi:hypothetical protein